MRELDDPLLGFSFYIAINDIIEAGFTACTGLSVKRDVYTYQEGGVNDHVYTLPGRTSYGNITLKQGITFSDKLWEWYAVLFSFGDPRYAEKAYRKVSIHQCIPYTATTLRQYELQDAFPVAWSGADLNTTSNEVAVESLEIAFSKFTLISSPRN